MTMYIKCILSHSFMAYVFMTSYPNLRTKYKICAQHTLIFWAIIMALAFHICIFIQYYLK